ncbi:23S rRNA (guanosine(2251)-2'-O)-methyltransferase RlmB [Cohnella sp. CBP 2801]|uniref:23S rRNA (Guanosine(2251)-2'-O)-methyltransferase RlmB n=1 Tax=Cohnella zeiphila TaxID=2761120 RepID=A0A7X0VYV9_9BACL|nr:23S rRNA (guanosine(2251)-2'-O)-methyltransferase RlmB [Cohnella zeiphila]
MNHRNRPRPSRHSSASAEGGDDRRRGGAGTGRRAPASDRPAPYRQDKKLSVRSADPELAAETDESAAESGEQYLAGKHPVLEALRAGRALNKIWLSNQAQRSLVQPIVDEAKSRSVVVQFADKKKLDLLVPGLQHQGVVAQAAAVSYAEVEDLLARAAERGEAPLLILLDEVEDPHNLGSILRTADCTGAHGIVVPKRRSASLTAVVAKTSAGAVEYVPVARVANLAQTIDKLKEAGVWIAGADAAADADAYRANLTGPLAIVIGSEGSGISRLVREKCDFLVSLPMFGKINSLNASVAAGVLLYEAVRQRRERQAGESAGLAVPGDGHASP